MKDVETFNELMTLAGHDWKALTGMLDPTIFSEEIFGFHAQQAIEKTLKAWLIYLDVEYPYVHDLKVLIQLVSDLDFHAERYQALVNFTVYGVSSRYNLFDGSGEMIDRTHAITEISALMDYVQQLDMNR